MGLQIGPYYRGDAPGKETGEPPTVSEANGNGCVIVLIEDYNGVMSRRRLTPSEWADLRALGHEETIVPQAALEVYPWVLGTTVVADPSGPTPPTISISAPSGTVSGTAVTISATVGGTGVLGVQFRVNGVNVGLEDTTAPYSTSWNTTSLANGNYTITAVARTAITTVVSAGVSVTVNNAETLGVAVTSPFAAAVVQGNNVTVYASTTGSNILGVQFKCDGVNIGLEDTTAPYSVVWDTTLQTNANHVLTATVRTAGQSITSAGVTVAVNNPTDALTCFITFPTPGANLIGSYQASASAAGTGLTGVQFKLDGVNLGPFDSTAPYNATIDTATLSAGSHTITAVASSSSGGTITSAPITFTTAVPSGLSVWIQSPAQGASITGTSATITAGVSGSSILGVQFKVDGNNVGAEDTTAPYSTTWDLSSVALGSHVISAVVRTATEVAVAPSVTVSVSSGFTITDPTTGDTVSDNIPITVSATGTGVNSVVFKCDGATIGNGTLVEGGGGGSDVTFTGSWPSAGGAWPAAWATSGGTITQQSGVGRMVTGATGAYSDRCFAILSGSSFSSADGEAVATYTVPADSPGWDDEYFSIYLRASGNWSGYNSTEPVDGYCVTIGGAVIELWRLSSGTRTRIDTASASISNDTEYKLKLRVEGSAIKARWWPTSGSEPGTWDLEATDTTVTAAGQCQLCLVNGYLGVTETLNISALTVWNLVTGGGGGGTTTDFTMNWDTKTVSNGSHSLTAVGSTSSAQITSPAIQVGVNNTVVVNPTGIPEKVVGLYWTNWASPNLTVSGANNANMFFLSFAVSSSAGTGNVSFTANGGGGISQSSLISAIDTVQARGAKVLISIGGASENDNIRMTNSTMVTQMVNSIISIVDTYGLDGVDWDLEDTGAQTTEALMQSACTQLRAHYGSTFIITCAEAVGNTMYENLVRNGYIDALGIMFYEDSMTEAQRRDQIVSYCTSMVQSGIPAKKLLIGNMYTGTTSDKQMAPSQYLTAYNTLVTNGIRPGGAFVWDMTAENSNSWVFTTTWDSPAQDGSIIIVPPPPPPTSGLDPWRSNSTMFWNKRLNTSAVHSNNAAWVSMVVSYMRAISAYGVQEMLWPNTNGFTCPIYYADANTPKIQVDYGGGWHGSTNADGTRVVNVGIDGARRDLLNAGGGVRIPVGAKVSPAADHELAIYDSVTDTLYEFWCCLEPNSSVSDIEPGIGPSYQVNNTGHYQTMAAGMMPNFSSSATARFIDTPNHHFTGGAYDGEGALWGTAATGLSYTGGRITYQDMIDGVIRHAIDISFPYNMKANAATWPAWRYDYGLGGPNEGQRFRLPASYNPSGLPPFARMIATCLRDYGAVINDLSGKMSLRFDSSIGFTSMGQADPWPTLFANYGITYGPASAGNETMWQSQANVRAALVPIPWEQLQFLPDNFGQDGNGWTYP